MATLAEYLLNEALPSKYKVRGELNKKDLKSKMTSFAKEDPSKYPEAITALKHIGDQIATYEGISVGLDDIAPQYKERDSLLSWAKKELKKSKTEKEFSQKLLKIQQKGLELAKQHPGTFGLMVNSGGRGNAAQLMKSVVSPLTVKDNAGNPYPYLITKSYAEGLSPAEHWIADNEARQEVIRGQLSTATPGDMSKQINATLNNVLITKTDCGTTNGIPAKTDDPQAIDRYLARDADGFKRNTLITDSVLRLLKSKRISEIVVRSPMTCLESPGVCQMCYGLNEKGQAPSMGTAIGLRSAQALSEPLTQMVLSSKHGVTLSKGEDDIRSVEGVRQLIEIPKSFKQEAVLAKVDGIIRKIEEAPQGGKNVYIGNQLHYIIPTLEVQVKEGENVYEGDPLSSGIVNPKDLVKHKGLGTGRNYLVNKMYNLYKNDGVDIDKRHLEILAKQNLNWVKITDPDFEGKYLPGDVVTYNVLKQHLKEDGKKQKVTKDVIGDYLADDVLYFTAGTRITPDVFSALKHYKIPTISITNKKPTFENIVKPIDQIPLLGSDWVSRLGHRRLKDTILQGAMYNMKSPLKGTAPYPSLIYGSNFGNFGENTDEPGDIEY